eukprot:GCRY01002793.1.p1 GENE.GCRY01002793.1~~GCRY01002793.1.p1  ORF type:complete len:501 (+),score=120.42 GCRY01002793.1:126-1628(+)
MKRREREYGRTKEDFFVNPKRLKGEIIPWAEISKDTEDRTLVHDSDAGLVIGKKGDTLKEFTRLGRTFVKVAKEQNENGERKVTFTGPFWGVQLSFALLKEILGDKVSVRLTDSANFLVPEESIGAVIGPKGIVRQKLEEDFNCKVDIYKGDGAEGQSKMRLICCRGNSLDLWRVVGQIVALVLEKESENKGNKPRAERGRDRERERPPRSSMRDFEPHQRGHVSGDNLEMIEDELRLVLKNEAMVSDDLKDLLLRREEIDIQIEQLQSERLRLTDLRRDLEMRLSSAGLYPDPFGPSRGSPGPKIEPFFIKSALTFMFSLPNSHVGCILGERGSRLRQIQETSDSHIEVASGKGLPSNALRQVDVEANDPEKVAEACKLLAETLTTAAAEMREKKKDFDEGGNVQVECLVQARMAGRVIGVKGSVLQEIEQMSRARVDIPKGPPGGQGGARRVRLQGTVVTTTIAMLRIADIVYRDGGTRRPSGGRRDLEVSESFSLEE